MTVPAAFSESPTEYRLPRGDWSLLNASSRIPAWNHLAHLQARPAFDPRAFCTSLTNLSTISRVARTASAHWSGCAAGLSGSGKRPEKGLVFGQLAPGRPPARAAV